MYQQALGWERRRLGSTLLSHWLQVGRRNRPVEETRRVTEISLAKGVQNAENTSTLCRGIPATDPGVGAGRTHPRGTGPRIEPTAQTIRNWLKQAELDAGERHDGLTSTERAKLARLRRENKQLRLEREILAKAVAGSHGRPTRCHPNLRVRDG